MIHQGLRVKGYDLLCLQIRIVLIAIVKVKISMFTDCNEVLCQYKQANSSLIMGTTPEYHDLYENIHKVVSVTAEHDREQTFRLN